MVPTTACDYLPLGNLEDQSLGPPDHAEHTKGSQIYESTMEPLEKDLHGQLRLYEYTLQVTLCYYRTQTGRTEQVGRHSLGEAP
jgi:hypothetical protein